MKLRTFNEFYDFICTLPTERETTGRYGAHPIPGTTIGVLVKDKYKGVNIIDMTNGNHMISMVFALSEVACYKTNPSGSVCYDRCYTVSRERNLKGTKIAFCEKVGLDEYNLLMDVFKHVTLITDKTKSVLVNGDIYVLASTDNIPVDVTCTLSGRLLKIEKAVNSELVTITDASTDNALWYVNMASITESEYKGFRFVRIKDAADTYRLMSINKRLAELVLSTEVVRDIERSRMR